MNRSGPLAPHPPPFSGIRYRMGCQSEPLDRLSHFWGSLAHVLGPFPQAGGVPETQPLQWASGEHFLAMSQPLPSPPDLEPLRTLHSRLTTEIRGQDHVHPRIASTLRRGQLGLARPGRPRGSFLLLGPTGVGKTETVLVATEHLLGARALIRLDMSEFQTEASSGLLLEILALESAHLRHHTHGNSPGKAPGASLLFDEIEKAHPKVLDLLLQMLDAASVRVPSGKTLDFQAFYLWLTTNIGGAEVIAMEHSAEVSAERHILAQAESALRPELFARISQRLVYRKLSYDVQVEIAAKFLTSELAFLASRGHHLVPAPEISNFLVRKGYHPKLGARPMREAVERLLGDAVAEAILEGRPTSGLLAVEPATDRLSIRG